MNTILDVAAPGGLAVFGIGLILVLILIVAVIVVAVVLIIKAVRKSMEYNAMEDKLKETQESKDSDLAEEDK